MFDKIKKAAGATRSKAESFMRIQTLENEIAGIRQKFYLMSDQYAVAVLDLYRRGQLTKYPSLLELAVQIEKLNAQVAEKQALIQAIRAEQPPQEQTLPQQSYNGYQQSPVPPNTQQAPVPPVEIPLPEGEGKACPNCRRIVALDTLFCPYCGRTVPH